MQGRAPMTETLEEVAAVATTEAAPAEEPSLFESFSAEGIPEELLEIDATADGVPAPAYRPAAAPSQPTPAASVALNHAPVAADDRVFVAPKAPPAGAPTPEALARLRDAIQRDAPRPAAPAPVAAPVHEAEQPARPRFGINTLINRMTGHGEEGPAPAAPRRTPTFSGTPPQSHIPARDDETAVDPDQERIEIPAFLRRQAN
jgi:cell division protein FtsZ